MSDPEPIIKPTVLRCKVAVLGDSRVGKSALCAMFKRHVNKSYPKNYIMTTGVDFTVKKVPIKDTHAEVELYLFDTSGHEVYSKVRSKFWEGSSCVMLCYDISDADSFKSLKKWMEEYTNEFKTFSSGKPQGVLVGTKSDLKEFSKVKQEDIESFCTEHGLEHFETSAKSMNERDVEGPFNHIGQKFYEKYLEKVKYFEELPL